MTAVSFPGSVLAGSVVANEFTDAGPDHLYKTAGNCSEGVPMIGTSNEWGDMAWATTYYLRVDEVANSIAYKGDVWSFATHDLTCSAALSEADTDGNCVIDANDLKAITENWLQCGFDPQFCT